MKRKQKRVLIRLILSAVLFVAAVALRKVLPWAGLVLFAASYGVIGWDILWRAVRNIAHGQVFDENFLMAIATAGAIIIGEYAEAVFVMIFYQVGELFQSIAVGNSRRSIASLMEIRPDSATVERDGETVTVDPSDVRVGEVVVVRPGEKIPLDGEMIDGATSLQMRALTGESVPVDAGVGDAVISGSVNLTGLIRVRVTKEFAASTVSKILELVENASANKSKSENFITKFARVYTPCVVIAACLLALLPPLFLGAADVSVWKNWAYRAMSFLVVSCPCALVISVPLSFFGGVGGMSRKGILVKGSNYIEALAKCDTVVFDKTGTLTRGSFEVVKVCGDDALLSVAAAAESASSHPVAQAIRRAYAGKVAVPASVTEIAGYGVHAVMDGEDVYVGAARLMERIGASFPPVTDPGTAVYVARGGRCLGYLVLADEIKADAKQAIAQLRAAGVSRTVMLTGDKKEVASSVAAALGIPETCAQLLPADKVEKVEELLKNSACLAFVGDGINDAPVLARADLGVAMGALGSDAAIEAADVVLMDDQISKLPVAVKAARATLSIVRQNIAFVLAVKLLILVLVALGLAGMWAAVFADVGVAVLAILNAMRAMRIKE